MPGFVAEMAAPANRPKLWFGVWSGFAITIGFAVLAASAAIFELTPWRWAFLWLVSVKLLTNSVAWLGLARDKWVMETQTINTITDVGLLTAAIYFTGGAYSPLISTYIILIAVLSLLTNTGITIMMAGFTVVCFSVMLILMATGVLPPTPVPGAPGLPPSAGYTITAIIFCIFVVGVPAFFSTATLRLLRVKEAEIEKRTGLLIS